MPADAPRRVQIKRTKGWTMPPNTVKVDRSAGFGNPFPIEKGTSTTAGVKSEVWFVGTWNGPAMWVVPTREEAVSRSLEAYRVWLAQPAQSVLADRVRLELRGKNLACWCPLDAPCHATVLLDLANRPICEEVSHAR